MLTSISPSSRIVLPGPVWNFSIGKFLDPFGPVIVAVHLAATNAGTLSPAGEPLHKLPPKDALPWICSEPIRRKASSTPGHKSANFLFLFKLAPETADPTLNSLSETSFIEFSSTIFLL
jgi:hypothetical protein